MELFPWLPFTQKHPVPIVLSLIGLIVAAGVGGTLWINSLHEEIENDKMIIATKDSELAQQAKTMGQTRELLERRYKNQLEDLKKKNLILSRQITIVKPAVEELAKTLPEIKELLNTRSDEKTSTSGNLKQLSTLATRLEGATQDIREALKTVDIINLLNDDTIESSAHFERLEASARPDALRSPQLWWAILGGGVIAVMAACMLLLALRTLRKREKELTAREAALAKRELMPVTSLLLSRPDQAAPLAQLPQFAKVRSSVFRHLAS